MNSKLYIIGNGFDTEHGLPTSYWDFRNYIQRRFPESALYCPIPESTLMPKGDEQYDPQEIARYIVRIIDNCGSGEWAEMEAYLGADVFEQFLEDLPSVNVEEEHCFRDVYVNEDMSRHILNSFVGVQELFLDWVNEELAGIAFAEYHKPEIARILDREGLFLTFNYTTTLEDGYKIPMNRICHIHGQIGDDSDAIYMGHGDDAPIREGFSSLGTGDAFQRLKLKLRKNTDQALRNNQAFFDRLAHVKEIYSYGFSFAEVDLVYIEEICRHVNPADVIWYINSYDAKKKPKYRDIIESYGFRVKVERRW